jgi:hypothetical protein
MDASTGQIVASALTSHDADDGAQIGPVLDQVTGMVASVTGDVAYDQGGVYASVAHRHLTAAVIVPPRAFALWCDLANRHIVGQEGAQVPEPAIRRPGKEAEMRTDISFKTEDGTTLRGWHYLPDESRIPFRGR